MKIKLERSNVQTIVELNVVQTGMLYHYLKDDKDNLYNIQLSLKITGDLDRDILWSAFRHIQAENEVLRSVFRWEETNKPIQIILKEYELDLVFHDLSKVNGEAPVDLTHLLTTDKFERFDLTVLPLKIRLIKLEEHQHLLVISFHHILYDGWSNAILLKELFQTYNALQSGQNLKPILKPDYANIQTQIIRDANSPEKIAFWKEYLKEVKPVLGFNQFNKRQNYSNSVSRLHIVPELGSLDDFAGKNKITKATIIYAAYSILLKIYSGSRDVVFGSTVSNRNPSLSGIENIMGNFITTIPLRVAVDDHLSNLEFIQSLNNNTLDRNKFHNSSLYEINKLLDISINDQLFDSVVGIENYPLEDQLINSVDSLNIEFEDIYENTNVPLVVLAFFKNNLELTFNYKSDIISEEVIQSFSKLLIEIVDKVIKSPNQKISDLISELNFNIEFLVKKFNNTQREFPEEKTIVDLFEDNVRERALKKGLVFNDANLSIEALNIKANQMAHGLISKGIRQGDLVVLMLEPSTELVIAMMGVLKAGAAYLPLDPGFPEDRISNICKQSEARLVVSQSNKTADGLYLDHLDLNRFVYEDYAVENVNLVIDPNDNAYVIFTSGTTGSPKGVTISHKNLVNYCYWLKEFVGFTAEERTVLATSFAFDLGYTVLFPSLIFGAELHLLPKYKLQASNDFLDYIVQNDISFLKLTPSLYATLCENQMFYKAESLRTIVLGGELIRIDDLEKTFQTFPNITVVNHYGPTETTIGSIAKLINIDNFKDFKISPSLGGPINNTQCFILNESAELVPLGAIGELHIAGTGLSKGYFNKEELTAEKFLPSRFVGGGLLYKTGDLCKWLPNGDIQFIGRVDHQLKIRGYRVETLEIKKCIDQFPQIQDALVMGNKLKDDHYLIAYIVSDVTIDLKDLKAHLVKKLPEYMIPLYFIQIAAIPLTLNGKIDLHKLPEPERVYDNEGVLPTDETEKILLGIWEEVLGQDHISTDRNFFEIGGDSLKLIKVNTRIVQRLACKVQITDFFEYPTIQKFATLIRSIKNKTTDAVKADGEKEEVPVSKVEENPEISDTDIAIIGMSANLPDADHIDKYWNNLKKGKDAITRSFDEASGGEVIRAKGVITGTDLFEASFFNYTPEEAVIMDPQMRMFHECCWLALEDSGYNPINYDGLIGLYGGASHNPLYNVTIGSDAQNNWMDQWQDYIYATKDFLCPRVSYKLNLKGPSINISTACSTSLVAVDIACSDLIAAKCDIALAGGVSLTFHDNDGYHYKQGMILSPDGFCRAFDKDAAGTVGGNGMGIIVLKKLKSALADGDYIHAIIKGSARNNDGADKIGFMAPSVEGQANVIKAALESAKVSPATISYIEAHGTGTILGDPIEFKGLKMAYVSEDKNYCALGSVKASIGHLNAASGIAGLIKVVLALKNKKIPPSLNFNEPNPNIDLDNSPFFINKDLLDWKSTGQRRAGVSSFGIGGTNAHVILEEAPVFLPGNVPYQQNMLLFSGKTKKSLQDNISNLRSYLEGNPGFALSDIANTLAIGRVHFNYRASVTCNSIEDAIEKLALLSADAQSLASAGPGQKSTVFMFPGQGAQYLNMCSDLYHKLPLFREIMEECFSFVKEKFNKDLRTIIFEGERTENEKLHATEFTQPLLFIVEFALAKTLMDWGLKPDIMIGHSVGEYVAACVSGVFTLEDALTLVVKRGELMQRLPSGAMLSIDISREKLEAFLQNNAAISIAALNTENSSVISGETGAVHSFKSLLEEQGYACKLIKCSHAFHSDMMDPMLDDFRNVFSDITINAHTIPFLSNLNGLPVIDSEISNPDYWVKHLRNTVEFSLGIRHLLDNYPDSKFLEIGPGKTLSSYLRSYIPKTTSQLVLNTVRHPYESINDLEHLQAVLGVLWSNKTEINWPNVYKNERRKRVPLPGYAFDRTKVKNRVINEPVRNMDQEDKLVRSTKVSEWFYAPGWKKAALIGKAESEGQNLTNIVFVDSGKLGLLLREKLNVIDENTIYVKRGASFSEVSSTEYTVRPDAESDFILLIDRLSANGIYPNRLIYSWTVDPYNGKMDSDDEFVNLYDVTLLGILNVFKAYALRGEVPLRQFVLFTNDLQSISGSEETALDRVPALGLLRSLSQEYPTIHTLHIDISLADNLKIDLLFKEIMQGEGENEVAYRNSIRWVRHYEKIDQFNRIDNSIRFSGKTFLITGGLGDLGFHLAKYLMKKYHAKIILTGRADLSKAIDPGTVPASELDENMALKASRLEALQQEGDVVYYACDISNLAQTIAVSEDITLKYGQINGIVHAAGIIRGNSKNLLVKLQKEDFATQFESKIEGIKVLKNVFGSLELEFCLISSSISTVLGGIGFSAYSSANIYMDYFINYYKDRSELKNWLAVNFDGLSLNSNLGDGIHADEIGTTFENMTSLLMLNQISISVADLNKRIKTWVNRPVEAIPASEDLENNKIADGMLTAPGKMEAEIIRIWKVFFGTDEIGIHDDFFDLGGDSLKALTMISSLYKVFGVKLSISDLFNHPTILEISQLLETTYHKPDHLKDQFLPIVNTVVKSCYKSTSVQKRLYFLFQLEKESIAYNMPFSVKLIGKLDRIKLENVLVELIGRHESLRTTFIMQEDEPVQVIADHADFKLEYMGSGLMEDPAIIADFVRPFDLGTGPLIRGRLIALAPDEHILLMDMHHIITDAVSRSILIRDFMSLYNGESLPVLRLQYKDYSEWQMGDEQQEDVLSLKKFWHKEFSDLSPVLQLPYDFSRPLMKQSKGGSLRFEINELATAELKAIADSEKTTMFMVLFSVYNIFLSKLGNQEDIVVGVPVSGRNHPDLEQVMGMFVNTLPLRSDLQGNRIYREYLLELKSRVLSCFDHQSYPYEALLDELNVPRDVSRNPLFDVMFSYENFEEVSLEIPGLQLSSYPLDHAVSKLDLALIVGEQHGKLCLNLEYSTALFTHETIERFADYLKNIISEIIEDQKKPLSRIQMLSEREQYELLTVYNDTASDYPKDKTIIDLFEEQVRKHPDHIALIFNEQLISFQELNVRSNQLARHLVHHGIIKGNIVGVMVERSVEMMISILAILKSGGSYLPLDQSQGIVRIASILKESGAVALLTMPDVIKENSFDLLSIDVSDEEIDGYEIDNLAIVPADAVYILYTSGSTGVPKGVVVGHQSVINLIIGQSEIYKINRQDRILLFSPVYFDASVEQIWLSLLNGIPLVLVAKDLMLNNRLFSEYLVKHRVTYLAATPSFLEHIVLPAENSLRLIVSGGEACKVQLAQRFCNDYNFYNAYGPTETTVAATQCLIKQEDIDCGKLAIGKPLTNIQVYVLGKQGELLPKGCPGELYISGDGLSLGYLHDAVLTKDKFVSNPYRLGHLMYKTGDFVRWRKDGNMEFLGRIDSQVKLRGFRIELGDIVSHLLANKEIREAVVIDKEKNGEKYLIAYYVSDQEIGLSELKQFLTGRLPEYMIPSVFQHLPEIPLNANGKIDRKALPEPVLTDTANFIAPSSKQQVELIKIWADILNLDVKEIGVNTNFFDMGGNSLKMIRMVNEINNHFKIEIPITKLFELPMIHLLSDYITGVLHPREHKDEFDHESDLQQFSSTLNLINRRLD